MEKIKRRNVVIAIIIALIAVGSVIWAVNYIYYSPFNNVWEQKIGGQDMYGTTQGGFAYIVSSTTNFSSYTFYYTVYKLNISSGAELWKSHVITFKELSYVFTLPSNKGPSIYVTDGMVYLASFNCTSIGDSIINNAKAGNFAIYGINSTTGTTSFCANFTPSSINKDVTFAYSTIFAENRLMVAYIDESYVGGQSSSGYKYNMLFHVDTLQISKNGVNVIAKVNRTLSFINGGWGTGSENIFVSGDNIAYDIISSQQLLWFNCSTYELKEFNATENIIGIHNQYLYYYTMNNKTIQFYRMSIIDPVPTEILTMSNFISNTTSGIFAQPLSDGGLFIEIQCSGIGAQIGGVPLIQNNILFMGFSKDGNMLWNISLSPNPYGTFTKILETNNGNVILATKPGALSYQSSYHSNILVINETTGKVLINKQYDYYINFPSGQPAMLSPPPFNGIITYSDNYLVYMLGNDVACARI